MHTGTVTELTPQDGLGWITLDDGTRVRFGGTACRAPVPTVGTRVRVLGTTTGYRGVLKATAVERLEPLPGAPPPRSLPRAHLAALDALGLALEPQLRAIVAAADRDDALFDGLEGVGFQLQPMPADELDCRDARFFVVAMDGAGNAYGLYRADGRATMPWVFWDHEDDTLTPFADDTAAFFSALLATARAPRALEAATRVREALQTLGIVLPPRG